jgi:hypothetical protein
MRTRNRALEQNADQLLAFATNWTRRSPNDPAAFEALAEMIEIGGDIGGAPFERTAAILALRRARALSRDPRQLTRLAAKEVWLRFKREEFADARRQADSLLSASTNPSADEAAVLLPIAALIGQVNRAAQLGRLSQPFLPRSAASMPTQVREAAVDLFVHAAVGICGQGISSLEKRLHDQIVRYVPAERAAELQPDLMRRPRAMAFPCSGGLFAPVLPGSRDRLSLMQQALATGQRHVVRALLDTVAEIQRVGRPGDMSLDYTYQQAWLRAAIGDTVGATQLLDNSLAALPALSADNLSELAAAAAIGRAMALRVELAAATHDTRAAQHWARALSTLWSGADTSLRPVVESVRASAGIAANR